MSRINSALLARLQSKLTIGPSRAYELIDQTVRRTNLPRRLAAIVVARDAGISISRFATDEDLALIRQIATDSRPTAREPALIERPTRGGHARHAGQSSRKPFKKKGNSVFVVHGRNEPVRKALFAFLRSIGLQPIEWNRALALTRKGSPYIGEVLDAAFRKAVAVVVLFTPDDDAKLKNNLVKRTDPRFERRLTGQPRPNVLFEAGMAFGRNAANTVLVQVGNIRPFSDAAGRHLVHLTNSFESRHQLIGKLKAAGCPVDDSGDDWHTDGDFES